MWQRTLTTFQGQNSALALYGQAETLHQLGRDAKAIPLYEQAIAAGLPTRHFWYRFGDSTTWVIGYRDAYKRLCETVST